MKLVWPLLLLIVGVCHAHPANGFNDDSSFFNPSFVNPTTADNLEIPGVGELHGLPGFKYIKNRPIDAFLGVRYAQVQGSLGRFQKAIPTRYQGRINATKMAPNCPQFPELQRIQEAEARGENVDDCLTLNIYTPSGFSRLRLPVLVFVHGEMLFDGGAEEAQPDYVLEHDVVLVSVNYRLAPFGFLSARSKELPGNVALSDLQLALEWVKQNIAHFGGDSDKVTLMGQAGGATLAHALSLSPQTQDLFQQLILQSGTALNPYLIDETPMNTLATFAQLARCPLSGNNWSALYECLGRLRTSQLVSVFEQLHKQNEPRGLVALGGFKLVVGDALGYLPEHPSVLVASNSKNNKTKPMIVGAAKDASAFIVSRFFDQLGNLHTQNISDYINVVLRHTAPPQHHKMWHDLALREIFIPEQVRNPSIRTVSQGLIELANLILYRGPVIDSIRLSHKKSPTYLYTFDYRGEHRRFGHLNSPLPFGVDASLSDDSVYLFPYPEEVSNLNPEDKSLARALVTMWVNFAQNGIPNPNPNVWPRAASEYGPFLRFTNSKENILELDQHFGEGIYQPNLYPSLSSSSGNTTATTSTTTTTTRRPYYNYRPQTPPQTPTQQPDYWRPISYPIPTQPPTQQPAYRRPGPYPNPYAKAMEERRQQILRQQQEQQQREQQQREESLRHDADRTQEQRQRDEQLQREQLQAEQYLREQQQRQQQAREQIARQQQEEREQKQREQEQRENETRQQQEREQRLREQQEREQQERERRPPVEPSETEQQRVQRFREQQEREQREQQLREQQEREQRERSQEELDQEAREQQEREQQQREQLEREQQERDQRQRVDPSETEQEREQRLRDQQEREQRERSQEERDQEAREQYEREQQQREQLEREQQERDQRQRVDPSETEQEREQRLRDQQEREQRERAQEERDQEAREQYEREQQQREQLEREQQERGQEVGQEDVAGPNPDAYPTYEDYVKAYENWIKEQESRYNPQANVSSEQDAPEEQSPVNNPYEQPNTVDNYQPYDESQNHPRRLKLMRRH